MRSLLASLGPSALSACREGQVWSSLPAVPFECGLRRRSQGTPATPEKRNAAPWASVGRPISLREACVHRSLPNSSRQGARRADGPRRLAVGSTVRRGSVHSTVTRPVFTHSLKGARQPRHPAHSKPATICYTQPTSVWCDLPDPQKSPTHKIPPARGGRPVSGFSSAVRLPKRAPAVVSAHLRADAPQNHGPESPADDSIPIQSDVARSCSPRETASSRTSSPFPAAAIHSRAPGGVCSSPATPSRTISDTSLHDLFVSITGICKVFCCRTPNQFKPATCKMCRLAKLHFKNRFQN